MFTKINKTWKIIITVIAVVLTAVIVTCIYDNDIESYETQIHSNIGSLANWIYS